MAIQKKVIILGLLTLLAFGLRVYRLGAADFKDDEFLTVKAAAYQFYCWQSSVNCQDKKTANLIFPLLQNNETIPNLITQIYLWDFIPDRPTAVNFNRAWPHLLTVAGFYRLFDISQFSSRLPGAIAGALLVPVGFLFSQSLLFSGLLAIAFPLIDISRNARMYSQFMVVILLAIYLWCRLLKTKPSFSWLALATVAVTALAYWLQSLTLVVLIGIYVYSLFKSWRWFGWLSVGLGLVIIVGKNSGADFFHRYFLGFIYPPHWEYLSWWFLAAVIILLIRRKVYLLFLILVYFLVLIFFTRPMPGAAYTIALWPLLLWPLLHWRRWLTLTVSLIVLIQFGLGINYLYFGRDDRAQIQSAYQILIDHYQSGDKLYAIQLRDYYLSALPLNTVTIDLQDNPSPEFSGSGFILWEQEKVDYFQSPVLEYIQTNFKHLAGIGLDNFGVEIYSFGK